MSTASFPVIALHRDPTFEVSIVPLLQSHYRVLDPLEESDSDPDVYSLYKSVRLLVCYSLVPVTSQTLDRYPSLECLVGTTSGVDHIDLAECRRRGIRVTNTASIFAEDTADYAIALFIDVLRQISFGDRFIRAGSWPIKGELPLGSKVGGKRVGIVGLGNIGLRIAKRLEAFGCVIAYNSRKVKAHVSYLYYDNILELAKWCDILMLCCSFTEETFHVVDNNVMTALGKKGIIINIGRGALIDEKELVQFLLRGELGGAGLDVFENEPNAPQELFGLDNVVLSPHRAVLTAETFGSMPELIMKNIDAFFTNKPLLSEIRME